MGKTVLYGIKFYWLEAGGCYCLLYISHIDFDFWLQHWHIGNIGNIGTGWALHYTFYTLQAAKSWKRLLYICSGRLVLGGKVEVGGREELQNLIRDLVLTTQSDEGD